MYEPPSGPYVPPPGAGALSQFSELPVTALPPMNDTDARLPKSSTRSAQMVSTALMLVDTVPTNSLLVSSTTTAPPCPPVVADCAFSVHDAPLTHGCGGIGTPPPP